MYIKTCWIAKVKRDLGLTRGKAWNNKSYKIPSPPSNIEEAIKTFILETMEKEKRIPIYSEVQKKVKLRILNETDPFLKAKDWAIETGISNLAQEHDRYAEDYI